MEVCGIGGCRKKTLNSRMTDGSVPFWYDQNVIIQNSLRVTYLNILHRLD